MEFSHIPVLLNQCIDGLNIRPDGIYLDGTCGGAGHSSEIAKRLSTGRLVGIDRDPDAVKTASERLAPYNAQVVRGNYSEMADIAAELGITGFDGILLDLGVSSYQLDTAERGFSYHNDAPLDMRMSKEGPSARDLVNTLSQKELAKILFEYGEEKFANRIAERIIAHREEKPIETTLELAEIIKEGVPAKFRREKNPCKKSFQAIRIAVNCEFDHLDKALDEGFELLNPGGRFCIITFHSLEDRIVKQRFASFCQGCTCPPDFPVCVCGKSPRGRLVNRKPVEADDEELAANSRSRSAKLRIIEKIK
ncbi:MAG: 16S rRNA (cytosine(1402)-N(4))-methyltransferase RsmH [Huintestinicola sp.]